MLSVATAQVAEEIVTSGGDGTSDVDDCEFGDYPNDRAIFDKVELIHAVCGEANGSLTIFAFGGIGIYEYSIDGTQWQSSNKFENLWAGEYMALVRDLGSPCNDGLAGVVLKGAALSLGRGTFITPTCDRATGTFELVARGGSGEYEYKLDGGQWRSSGYYNYMEPGTYIPYARDKNHPDCIVQGAPIVLESEHHAPSVTLASKSNATCGQSNGSITLSGSGGLGTYEYRINDGAWQTAATFSALAPGFYLSEIRNNTTHNGRCATDGPSIEITGIPALALTVERVTHTTCGDPVGEIRLLASGGVGFYEYQLNGGFWQSSRIFDDLPADSYVPAVRNSTGDPCTLTGAAITVNGSTALTVAASSSTNPSACGVDDGSITISRRAGRRYLRVQPKRWNLAE